MEGEGEEEEDDDGAEDAAPQGTPPVSKHVRFNSTLDHPGQGKATGTYRMQELKEFYLNKTKK